MAFDEVLEVAFPDKNRSEWYQKLRLVRRSTVWCPTWLGVVLATALVVVLVGWWWTCGESFLSLTRHLPPEVLAVEGWIGYEGIRAAAAEFKQHEYQYVVATGSLASERWEHDRASYAEMAGHELIRSGVPLDRIIVAPASDNETQRTYQSAVAVGRALQSRGIHPNNLNVFTWGPHARRSLSVYTKVFQPGTKVGVISWTPPGYRAAPWWQSSERARELLTETAGYLFEFLFDSGRGSHPADSGEMRGRHSN